MTNALLNVTILVNQWTYLHYTIHTYIHTGLTALCPGLPGWASTRKVKPIWILLKQETVGGSGISWAICKSAPHSRQITMPAPHHSVFTGRMPLLPPNQQRQSTEGTNVTILVNQWTYLHYTNYNNILTSIVTTLIYLPLQYLWFILYVPFWSDNVIFVWRLWHSSSIDVAGIARPQRPEQLVSHTRVTRLVAWHSGRTSVSGRRTFPVLRSTCSWWVTTNTTNEIQESTGQLQK